MARYLPPEIAEARLAMVRNGASCAKVARAFGVSAAAVYLHAVAHGVRPRGRNSDPWRLSPAERVVVDHCLQGPASIDELSALLHGDSAPRHARVSVRVTVSRARAKIAAHGYVWPCNHGRNGVAQIERVMRDAA